MRKPLFAPTVTFLQALASDAHFITPSIKVLSNALNERLALVIHWYLAENV
jgi:hypothetical protein